MYTPLGSSTPDLKHASWLILINFSVLNLMVLGKFMGHTRVSSKVTNEYCVTVRG